MASPSASLPAPAPAAAADPSSSSSFLLDADADAEIDASLDQENDDIQMTMAPPPPENGGFDGVAENHHNPLDTSNSNQNPAIDPPPEPRIPARKDMSLREFLGKMDEYGPIIPDAVTAHALVLAGLPPPNLSSPSDPTATPLHLSRLLALATQKFIADIAADAYQYSRMRSGNTTSNSLNAMGGLGIPGGGGPGQGIPGGQGGGTAAGVGGAQQGNAGGGGTGAGAGKEKGGTGQHVLGVQRAGFGGGGQGGGQGRTVLTMEDLGMAVGEYGVNIRRGEFYR